MKYLKSWSCRLLFPGRSVVLALSLFSASFLFHIFTGKMSDTWLAYLIYMVSFYTIVVLTARLVQFFRQIQKWSMEFPLAARYQEDAWFRVRTGLIVSFILNLCYALFRIFSAARYTSFWDGALGGYYAMLCTLQLYLIIKTKADILMETQREVQLMTGWLLLILNLALSGVAYQIVMDGRGYQYPGTLIYAVAAYTFYVLLRSIVQLLQYRRFKSPVLSAAKSVNLTTALVSLFSLETAMMDSFGEGESYWEFMLPATAAMMCVLVLLIALSMIFGKLCCK